AEHQAGAAADSEGGRDEPDPRGHALAWELVTDDPEGEREHRSGRALHGAPGDQEPEAVRQRRDHRADREHHEDEEEDALLPEHVAEPPQDRGEDGRAQEVDGEDPRDGGGSRGQREHAERDVVVLAWAGVRHSSSMTAASRRSSPAATSCSWGSRASAIWRRRATYSRCFLVRAARPVSVSEMTTARRSVGSATRETQPRSSRPSTIRVAVGAEIPASSASSRFVRGPSPSGSSTWYCASERPPAMSPAARPRARRAAWKKS